MRIDDNMHSVAFSSNAASGDQVRAKRVILRQICSEVHFLPLELLAQLFFPRESKLTQVPAADEVDLAVDRRLVDLVRVRFVARLDPIGILAAVGAIMT